MRDVEELCQRVLVINHGKIEYDGNLTGILEKFAQHKLLHIRFRNSPAEHELKDFGIVVKNDPPTATIEVARASVLDASAQLMQKYDVEDLSIEEVPIEEVMANMFETKGPENGNP
jgi:ABC-2 type transport system ATP-binding protein